VRHLEDAREQITAALDPHAMRTRPAAAAGGRGAVIAPTPTPGTFIKYDFDNDPFLLPPKGCWPDIIIR